MRAKIFIYVALVTAMVSSCTKYSGMRPGDGEFCRSIVATVAGPGTGTDTKAVFDTVTKSISWELGDKIVVDGATYMRKGETNVFDYYSGGVTTGEEAQEAYYPASLYTGGTGASSAKYSLPNNYEWDKDAPKVDFVPMAGKVKTNAVTFHALTSVFRVRVRNNYGSVIYLCGLSISADKALSGDFTATFDETTGEVSSVVFGQSSKSMSLTVKGLNDVTTAEEGREKAIAIADGEEYSLYIPVPAAQYGAINLKVTAFVEKDGQNVLMYSNSSKTTGNLTCYIGRYYDISFNASEFEEGVSGTGTVDDPFLVDGLGALNYIKGMVTSDNTAVKQYFCDASYRLEDDLTLTDSWTETMAETISGGVAFSGMFDGNGHTIEAGGGENTRPIFWDINGGVIKNVILKGVFTHNNGGCPLYCPFFYSSIGRTVLVCVVFKGTETWADGGTGLSLFGAVHGDPHLVGAYAEAKVRGFAEMGDDLTTQDSEARNTESYLYRYMFSDTFMSRDGYYPYYVNGAVAKITGVDSLDFSGAKIVHAWTENDPLATKTEVYTPTDADIVEELNRGILEWNRIMRTDSRVSEIDVKRFSTSYKYEIVPGEGITLVQNN
ncbi:MAG: fimbrillin family protein [Bacteroidales bacterium]|nr:fimbrillin family protein [Bacteroidales bacterium]